MNVVAIVGPIRSRITPVPPSSRAALLARFTIPVAGAYFARRARPGWDGAIRYFAADGSFLSGFLPEVVSILRTDGHCVTYEDRRSPARRRRFGACRVRLRDYQAQVLHAVLATGARCTVKAATNCLVGSTMIGICRNRGSEQIDLARLVYLFNGGTISWGKRPRHVRSGPLKRRWINTPTYVRAMDEDGYIRLAKIVGAYVSGIRQVMALMTESGHSVTGTAEHRFLTPNGWRRFGALKVGDVVYVERDILRGNESPKGTPYRKIVSRLWGHPYATRRGVAKTKDSYSVFRYRLVVETVMNGLDLDVYIARLRKRQTQGLRFLNPETWGVHHKNENTRNDNPDNLEAYRFKGGWHSAEHGRLGGWKRVTKRVIESSIVSIEPRGRETTYDLEVEGMQNFLANGVVVHNSGKTELAIVLTHRLAARAFSLDALGAIR